MANDKNPISDELLAAYLDGNTNEAETRQVIEALHSDASLREAMDIALNTHSEPLEVLPMMQMAAESGENLCSVMCEAFILNRRGMDCDEQALLRTARDNNWLQTEGSPLHAMGQLLAHQGLMINRKYDATLDDITRALERDNDIIVAVDSDRLHMAPDEDSDAAANHAVVVTAVAPDGQAVTLYDPEQGNYLTVDIDHFVSAWQPSQGYMVRVLQTIEDYDPQPINLEDIPLTDDLMELREAIAENAHDVWAAARIAEGWTYGDKRDDTLKHHPDLLPYSALPDSEKEYDRLMALNTIKLVKKLGFNITKRH